MQGGRARAKTKAGVRASSLARAPFALLPLVLAYALVFQVVLASGLMAAQAANAFDAGSLCLSTVGAGDLQEGAEGASDGVPHGPQAAVLHCPLCLSRVDAVVLPPPAPNLHIERLATPLRFEPGQAHPVHIPGDRPGFRPRDPPVRVA
ncbi:hypothetical protein J5J86_17275 [Aquabacter sp. L1I39]|uniref:DUF2946 family protein n=1 Tax=Aquabacter sp. L1I39 TaxID=2820278 RepID=UPI001ADA149F|nr:DUF2946 family protein [Aquabacter sp. L1I39]QTL02530.1 hypothetical protein J5J86_17275 [Aquabacter sp. L1I39]